MAGGTAEDPEQSDEQTVQERRLAILLRLALDGKTPSRVEVGDIWPVGTELADVFMEFADLEPFKQARKGIEGQPRDVAKQRIARALSVWLAERSEEPPAGLALDAKRIAIVLYLAAEVAQRGRAEIPENVDLTSPAEDESWTVGREAVRKARAKATDLLARFLLEVPSPDPRNEREKEEAALSSLKSALRSFCTDVPSWFPDRLTFAQVRQQVSVTPPTPRGPAAPPDDEAIERDPDPDVDDGASAQRKVSLSSALRQFGRLLIVGDPGSGKSWALRSLAFDASAASTSELQSKALPLLALAPLLEKILADRDVAELDRRDLVDALIRSMPLPVLSRLSHEDREVLVDLASDGRALLVLLDGYDELRSEQPMVAQVLESIEALCLETPSHFVLTTRPSSMPPKTAGGLAWCNIDSFTNREQWTFILSWFSEDRALVRRLSNWVREHRLEVMRSPLMLSLFCSIVETGGEPPANEHELWERALVTLASDQGRYGEVPEVSERTRLRLALLEALAATFIDDGLREHVSSTEVEEALSSSDAWLQLVRVAERPALDDLVATGIVRMTIEGVQTDVSFLHSAFRDYLVARSLVRSGKWQEKLPLIWRHPELEPVIGYLGALSEDASELLSELVGLFVDDPLNIARLVAGRALAAVGAATAPPEITARVRDELLVLLCSPDAWDRSRAATVLPVMGASGTTERLTQLLTPSAPTRVIVAAISALAGSVSPDVRETLSAVVTTKHFTPAEREAAVDAIADAGTDDDHVRIVEIARNDQLPPGVRASAALAAWASFDNDAAVAELLQTGDSATQRLISERVADELQKAMALAGRIRAGTLPVPDGCARAVILAAASENSASDEAHDSLVEALPGTPALERIRDAADAFYDRASTDPAFATFLRFLRGQTLHRVRWQIVRDAHTLAAAASASEAWWQLIESAQAQDAGAMAEFLADEIAGAPELVRSSLEADFKGGSTPPIVDHEIRRREKSATASAAKPPESRPADSEAAEDPPHESAKDSLEALLTADIPSLYRYGLLRVMRPRIPHGGLDRRRSTILTNRVSAAGATAWVDALPSLAPVVEARLLGASDETESLVELARLRSRWPGRSTEVMHSSAAIDARVLDAGAEAAMYDGDLTGASMLALASLGASSIDDLGPSRTAIGVLFASAHATGRANSTWHQIRKFLGTLRRSSLEWILLASWLEAAYNLVAVGERLEELPAYLKASNAEVAALLIASRGSDPSDLGHLVSWADCRRAQALLAAARGYSSSQTAIDSLDAAAAALDTRSRNLVGRWPSPDLGSPALAGKPKWHWTLVRIASKRLEVGDVDTAIAVYETVVDEDPGDPESRNNLGFCRMAVDTERALEDLEASHRLFGRPFGVNTANRMLANLRLERYETVLEIAEELVAGGGTSGNAILWEIDAPAVLARDVDVMLYVIELAERAAHLIDDPTEISKWQQRRRVWRPSDEEA